MFYPYIMCVLSQLLPVFFQSEHTSCNLLVNHCELAATHVGAAKLTEQY